MDQEDLVYRAMLAERIAEWEAKFGVGLERLPSVGADLEC